MLVADNFLERVGGDGRLYDGFAARREGRLARRDFLALTIDFPFIVYGLIVATGARGVGGAAGAVVVAAGVCGAFCVAMAATTYFVAQGKQRTFAPGAAKPAIATFRRA